MEQRDSHDRASDQADRLADKTKAFGEAARTKLGEMAEPIKDKARSMAEEQKSAGADELKGLGGAIHGAANELEKELPQTAGYIHSAADTLQSASSVLRDRSIEDLLSAFNNFAKQQPAAAFAGSVLAGFALSRFLKSSGAENRKNG